MPIAALALSGCSFFAQASGEAMAFTVHHMNVRHLRRREVLQEKAEGAFLGLGLVLQGSLLAIDQTVDGREAHLFNVQEGETFGLANLVAHQPTEMTWVAASTPTAVAVMSRSNAEQLLRFPEMTLALAQAVGQQVCDFLTWQKIQGVHPVSARVCAWLLRTASMEPRMRLPRNAEMAWRLNTSRETVNRLLQRLLSDGVLRKDGDYWFVDRPQALAEMARGDDK